MSVNVLLTSAGRRSYIIDYFKQCSGIGKVYASNSLYSIALQRADQFFISPLIYSNDYIKSIISFCKQNDIKIVLSLFDIDLLILSKNYQLFKDEGIELVLAPEKFIRVCNDKWETNNFLNALGIKTPKTFINLEEVICALNENIIQFPIIIKPRWGMASIGIYKANNIEELKVLNQKCIEDIFSSHLKYESSITKEETVIFQELIRGKEYGLDVINDLKGNYVATFAKQKVSMRSGETDMGLTCASKPFIKIGSTISEYSLHHGICSVDCIISNEDIYVIEINCRISGHYPIAHLAGLNYPQLILDWFLGKETNPVNLRFKEGMYVIKDLVPTILRTHNQ